MGLRKGKGEEDKIAYGDLEIEMKKIAGIRRVIPNPFLTKSNMPFDVDVLERAMNRRRKAPVTF
jgi:hypothetical protein